MPIARGSWRLGEVSGFRENSLDTGLRTFSAVTDNASIAHLSTCPCAGCMKSAAPDEPDAQIDGGSDGIPPRSELDWTIAPWAREGVGYDIARIHDGGPEQQNPGAGGDTIGNTTATAGSISIGGSQNGYVNTVGDDDWYAVTLVAGQSYAFSLTGGTLADAYLELRNSLGNLIAIDDDFGPGINSLLRFTPTTSGTYYINARGFEDDGVENTGSYTLTAATAAPASPLDSIDFHFTMPTTSIAIWFAPQGFTNPQGDTASRAWMQTEIDAVFAAAATYSAFTPLTFTLAASQAAADWILSLADLEGNVLGYFAPDNIGYGAFDPTVSGWSAGLHPGGNSWVTLIHEFGHGLGMAHPHDNSAYNYGVNNSEIMQGVTGPFGSYGTFLMNQGVFTTMGYNDSWALSGFGATPSNTTGGQSTPMALDVALMQQGYGVNPTTGSGDTAYTLALSSTSYSCIWDVSGADVISYSGSGVATIDLRAATLLNAVGGGGYVSFVFGVHGGFTIANGVVIENATGGSGADTLIGNDAANILNGGAGADTMTGNAGDDTYVVDNPSDAVNESSGGGADTIQSSVSWTLGANFENLTLTGGAANGTGNAVANVITGNSAANTLSGGGDNDSINGGDGADTLMGEDGADTLNGGDGADTITGGAGVDNVSGGDGDDVINYNFGDGVDSSINGGAGTDRIVTQGHAGGETLDVIWNGAAFTAFKGSAVVSVEQAIVDMGGGVDWLRHHNSSVAVNVNLGAGTATGFLSIANIENAWGSAFNDTLTGSAVANIIRGGAGDDAIDGGAGADTIVGDDGADAINGGDDADSIYGLSGADIVNGGNGDDTINYSFGEGVDSIDGGAGTDTIICQGNSGAETLEVAWDGLSFTFFKGGAVASIEQATVDMGLGGDWLRFTASSVGISINLTANTASGFLSIANVENAAGGGFNDTITGSAAANNLLGNDGADAIDGAGGNDTLNGGAGADTLTGGAGSDSLTGGADADTFVFATGAGGDTINDFDANATGGQDFLNIVGYGITSGDFGPRVVISDQGVNTLVTIDGTNTILLLGVTGDGNNVITQADFILGP